MVQPRRRQPAVRPKTHLRRIPQDPQGSQGDQPIPYGSEHRCRGSNVDPCTTSFADQRGHIPDPNLTSEAVSASALRDQVSEGESLGVNWGHG